MDPSSSSPQPSYGRRNIFYLRVSPQLVLPCILYIDPRHVRWLNTHPSTMSATLNFLKGRIMDKLDREAKVVKTKGAPSGWEKKVWGEISGREVVDVARLADFHVAYFFRRQSDRHAVLVKEKDKVFPGQQDSVPPSAPPRPPPTDDGNDFGDKEGAAAGLLAIRSTGHNEGGEEGQIKPDPEDEESAERRRLSSRGASVRGGGSGVDDDGEHIEDVKPKFKLRVKYRGFKIFTKSLIIVLEPSPAARARSPDLFATQQPSELRQLSLAPVIGAGVSAGTLYSSHQGFDPRRGRGMRTGTLRQDSIASTTTSASSRRDARTGNTPLFRGSMTPSDTGDDPLEAWSPPCSPPSPSSLDTQTGIAAEGEVEEQEDGQEETAYLLAQRILTQDGGGSAGTGTGGTGGELRLEGRGEFGFGFSAGEED